MTTKKYTIRGLMQKLGFKMENAKKGYGYSGTICNKWSKGNVVVNREHLNNTIRFTIQGTTKGYQVFSIGNGSDREEQIENFEKALKEASSEALLSAKIIEEKDQSLGNIEDLIDKLYIIKLKIKSGERLTLNEKNTIEFCKIIQH